MVNVTLSYASFTVESSALPENSIEHLLRLGFSTAIKNSIAGVKAGVLGNGANPWSDDDIKAETYRLGISSFTRDEQTATAICNELQREMFESIVSGKTRAPRASASRISPDDKLRRDIAIELLEKWSREKGKTLPKRTKADEKAAFEELLAKATEKWSATIEKEFKARKGRKFDLDDII
jgi:hypothetical protein